MIIYLKTKRLLLIVIFSFAFFGPSYICAEDNLLKKKAEHKLDSQLDTVAIDRNGISPLISGLMINAGTENSNAVIRLSLKDTDVNENRKAVISGFALIASAPIKKKGEDKEIATLDGLVNAFTLGVEYSSFHMGTVTDWENEEPPQRYYDVCAEVNKAREKNGLKEIECDEELTAEMVNKFRPDLYDDYMSVFREEPSTWSSIWYWGANARVGYEIYDYLDNETAEELDVTETPWSAKVYIGFVPKGTKNVFKLGYEYQDTYKEGAEGIVCPNSDEPLLICKGDNLGAPKHVEKHLLSAEYRGNLSFGSKSQLFAKGIGVSVLLTHDLENDATGLDVPIYLFRNTEDSLVGGIKLGWNDSDNEFRGGIFVGGTFKLFN